MITETDIQEMLIVTSDLESEFEQMAASYARLAYQYARACDTLRHAEAIYELEYSQLYFEAKKEIGASCKEAEAKAYIRLQERHTEILYELNEAKRDKDILSVAKEALVIKKEMLQQLGPMRRNELGNYLTKTPAMPPQRPRKPKFTTEDVNAFVTKESEEDND